MEKIISDLRAREETFDSSQLTRLKPPSRSGIYEDLGSSLKPSQSIGQKKVMAKKHVPILDLDSESEDEMDVLSQSTQADEKIVTGKPKSNGQSLPAYHPDVLETRSQTLKTLKFNKTKPLSTTTEKEPTVSPLRSKSQARVKGSRHLGGLESESNDEGIARNTRKPKNTPSTSTMDVEPPPKPKPRPRPRPVVKSTPDTENSDPSLSTPAQETGKRPLSSIPLPSPLSHLSHQKNDTILKPKQTSSRSIANSSSASSNTSTASSSSHPPPPDSFCSITSSSNSTLRLPQKFPSFSPLNSPTPKRNMVAAVKSFPDLSPLSKDAKAQKGKGRDKGKRKATSRDLQPFPMSTQVLGDIAASSDGGSDAEGHTRKRKYQGNWKPSTLDQMDVYEEEDSLFMSPAVDPKTLCPYCDAPLPDSPTPFLKRLLVLTAGKSHPDPRSTNPLGRKAPLSTFVTVCQRHRFESEILPEAETKGWPKTIDWEGLGERIARMKWDLQDIVDDPGDTDMNLEGEEELNLMTSFIGKGPRMKCVFWREAMKAIKMRGSRAVAGVKGQYLDFEKIQPGYYGELGSMIIHQTLLSMFPLDSFNSKTIAPFTSNEFIQRILVPEVALRLIMEDRGLKGLVGSETALEVLRESTAYGAVMFPEDGGEGSKWGGKFGVGDRIVMERAKKRRKEIEEGVEMEEIERLTESMQESEMEGGNERDHFQPFGGGTGIDAIDKPGERQLQRKKGKGSGAKSVDFMSDGNETGLGGHANDSLARSRPRRAIRTVNYVDASSDEDQKPERSKPGSYRQHRTIKQTKTPSRSPPIAERPSSRVKKKSHTSSSSDTDMCFTDEDATRRKEILQIGLPGKGTSKIMPGKYQREAEVNELDLNTPLLKRGGQQAVMGGADLDPTPRPVRKDASTSVRPQESVLARVRARSQKVKETGGGSEKPKSKPNSGSEASWSYNLRTGILEDSSSSSPSDISEPSRAKTKKRIKRAGTGDDYGWLLSDPSSQETHS